MKPSRSTAVPESSVPAPGRAIWPSPVQLLPWLRYLLVALSAFFILTFLNTAKKRLHYPFQYDWIEDGILACVQHMRSGLPLYQAPSVDYAPFLYTPLYFYVAAGMARFTGPTYAALRLVSIFSTLGCFGVIYAFVYAEVRRHFAAIAAAGCFAACYPLVHQWFDLGRIDMLYLFLMLCALFATRYMHPVAAALLWVLVFQTKQGALPVAVVALSFDWHRPGRIAVGLGTFAAALAGSIAWLNHVTNGWYSYYVFGLPGALAWDLHQAKHFVPTDLLNAFGLALLLVLAAVLVAPPRPRSRTFGFYVAATLGMVVFTAYIRSHRGANVNSLLPAYAWIAILFGIALVRLCDRLERESGRLASVGALLALSAAAAQLAMYFYAPREFVPVAEHIERRSAFEGQIRSIPGDVLVINFPEDGLMAGKPLHASSEAVGAIIDAKNHVPGDRLMADFAAAFQRKAFSAVVLYTSVEHYPRTDRTWMPKNFLDEYPLKVEAIGDEDLEFGNEPRWIYFPCSSEDAAKRVDPQLDTSMCSKP